MYGNTNFYIRKNYIRKMKISDLQNYETPKQLRSNKQKGEKPTKLSSINSIGQKLVDFTLVSLIRFTIFIASLKIASLILIPQNIRKEIAEAVTPQEKMLLSSIYGVNKIAIWCIILAFICGTLYYVLMITKTQKGTIGMRFAKLSITNRMGEKPTAMQTLVWYHMRLIYPVCGILSLVVFKNHGMNGTFLVLILLAAAFSDTPRMMLGISSLSEKLSGVTLFDKK